MTAHYTSKTGDVARRPEELYMAFTDLRNFARMVPRDKVAAEITADFDQLSMEIQGFRFGVRVDERQPYSLIRLGSSDSPVEFVGVLHFEASDTPGRTRFWIDLDANLNFMMKTMLGGRIQEAVDKLVDGLVDASEGRMPQMPGNLNF